MNALSNEYYRLYDLVEKALDYIGENDDEDYEDDGGAEDDYDIEPIKKTVDKNTQREELWGRVWSYYLVVMQFKNLELQSSCGTFKQSATEFLNERVYDYKLP